MVGFKYRLCDLLVFISKSKHEDAKEVYNKIFLYSLNELYMNGLHYKIIPYEYRREPKGFLIEKTTEDKLHAYFETYKDLYNKYQGMPFTYGEFIELLMFIYCQNNLEKKDFVYLDMNDWGIIDTKIK